MIYGRYVTIQRHIHSGNLKAGKVQETQKLKGILLRNTLHTKKAGKKAVFWFYILIIMLGLLYSDYNARREQF